MTETLNQSINILPLNMFSLIGCQVKTSSYLVYDYSAYLNLYFWILDQFKITRFLRFKVHNWRNYIKTNLLI